MGQAGSVGGVGGVGGWGSINSLSPHSLISSSPHYLYFLTQKEYIGLFGILTLLNIIH